MREYLSALICTSAFCAICLAATPEGRVRTVVSIACGIAMITAIVSPISTLDFSEYSESLAEYREYAENKADEGAQNSNKLNRMYIEEQCKSYILDKAESIGACVSDAKIGFEWSRSGYWYPVSAEICADCPYVEQEKLMAIIEAELGISRSAQDWSNTYEER